MLSVAHHDVEAGTVLIVQNTNNLVDEIQFVFGRVLVILNSFYFVWFHMRSESSFELELGLGKGLLDLLQLALCCFEKSSDLVAEFLLFELVASNFIS